MHVSRLCCAIAKSKIFVPSQHFALKPRNFDIVKGMYAKFCIQTMYVRTLNVPNNYLYAISKFNYIRIVSKLLCVNYSTLTIDYFSVHTHDYIRRTYP